MVATFAIIAASPLCPHVTPGLLRWVVKGETAWILHDKRSRAGWQSETDLVQDEVHRDLRFYFNRFTVEDVWPIAPLANSLDGSGSEHWMSRDDL